MMKSRWENMSAAEKVAYIEKMQTGSSDNRVVTIYAWNNSKKLREDMSKYFVENNFYNPHSVIYRDTSYTNSMSILMTDFWKNNPKAAVEFGETLSIAHEEFQKAKDDERLEEFIKKTYEDRDKIKNEIKQFVSALKIANAKNAESFSDNFKKVFSDLPSDIVDFIADAVSKYPKDVQDIYFKACKGVRLKKKEEEIVKNIDDELGNADFKRYSAFL